VDRFTTRNTIFEFVSATGGVLVEGDRQTLFRRLERRHKAIFSRFYT
jgi:hypothetical protein